MAANTYPKNHRQDKQLIVEGKNDLLVIAEFMEQAGVLWLTNNPPVHIVDSSGKPNLPTHTKGILKSDLWENLGIVVDADHDPQAAWQSSRNLCAVFFRIYLKESQMRVVGLVKITVKNWVSGLCPGIKEKECSKIFWSIA